MSDLRVLGGFRIDMAQAPAAAITQNSGIVDLTNAPVDNGAGDWSVNLLAAKGIDSLESFCVVTVVGVGPLEVALEHVTDTQKRIRTLSNAGAGTDAILDVVFLGRGLI